MIPSPWLPTRAQRSPDAPGLWTAAGPISYAALDARARRQAAALHGCGVRPGSRVALLAANHPDFVASLHALDRLAAVAVPLNWRLAPPELWFQLDHAGVRVLLHDAAHAELAEAACAGASARPVRVRIDAAEGVSELAPEATPRSADDPFAVLFTSGTTGRPKAAELSRGAFLWSAVASAFQLGVLPGDRWLACMPLFHVGGLSILWRSVLYGTSVVLHERFDAECVSHALDRDGVTAVSLTATMLERLLRVRQGRPASGTLRFVLLGGGPCPRPLLDEAASRGFRIASTYGLTEACSQVATRSPEADADGGLAPLLGTSLRIVGDDDHALPAGEVGEILVRGPTLMRGYLHDPEASARTLRDGWLHTGDLGRLDAAGALHVLDRRSDLIVSGGENVYPAEVEQALLAHPDVAEVAVAGVDDAEFGRRPAAWWVAREGAVADGDALRAFCRARLAGYKVPVAFRRVDALPRDGAGKLRRRALADAAPC